MGLHAGVGEVQTDMESTDDKHDLDFRELNRTKRYVVSATAPARHTLTDPRSNRRRTRDEKLLKQSWKWIP